jgi:hypothetical protein
VSALTFVAAVNNEQVLQINLLGSPCFQGNHDHQILLTRDAGSVAEVYNAAIERAENDLVVFLHQDVYLPGGWPALFQAKFKEAEEKFGTVDVAGVYGVTEEARYGRIMFHGTPLREPGELPAKVRALDELLLALPRRTSLRFDPALGFHLYGADIAMQARTAVVLDAECHHNSGTRTPPSAFYASQAIFREKWRKDLPICTPCAMIR